MDEVRADLARLHKACDDIPTSLCIVGWPDTLPMAVIDHGQRIDADLVSDLPYGQTDEDPFVELAVGRIVAEDCASATLIACRGLAYELFPNRSWAHRFATAEWEEVSKGSFLLAGLEHVGHHPGEQVLGEGSPLTEVGLFVHASHASWTTMGKTYNWNSKALLAPCLVSSAGCSTASLDQDGGPHRSVASRLLRNGAIAFVGNMRRGIAQQALFESEFMSAVLAGKTVGEANRHALNRVTVAVLEKDQGAGGSYYYQLYNHTLYGDPAWSPKLTGKVVDGSKANRAARVEVRGQIATVHAPSKFLRSEAVPNPEWKCIFPAVYNWRGAGMGVESRWHGQDKRNEDELFFTSEVRTCRRCSTVEPMDEPAEGLGWTGKVFVDKHADGTRSIFWRVRLIDFDMTNGEVRSQAEKLRFRLRTR